jgi:hypothetical protein
MDLNDDDFMAAMMESDELKAALDGKSVKPVAETIAAPTLEETVSDGFTETISILSRATFSFTTVHWLLLVCVMCLEMDSTSPCPLA